MKRFTLTIVANNAYWPTWQEKVRQIQEFFNAGNIQLDVTMSYTSLKPVFEKHPELNKVPGQAPIWTIDRLWYDANISAQYKTDLVCLIVPSQDKEGRVTVMGLMTGKDVGPWELTVFGDQNDNIYIGGVNKGSSVAWFIIHELCHAFYAMLGKGVGTGDQTHHYFKQEGATGVWEPEKVLPDFTFRDEPTPAPATGLGALLEALKNIFLLLTGLGQKEVAAKVAEVIDQLEHPKTPMPTPPKIDRVKEFCLGIKEHEGTYPPSPAYPNGSRAWRNNNPGNFRYSSVGYHEKYGTVKKDAQNFAIFNTPELGWLYLYNFVNNAATGKSTSYRASMTFFEFFAKYAPAEDSNDPKRYAEVVAKRCGLPPTAKLLELVQ